MPLKLKGKWFDYLNPRPQVGDGRRTAVPRDAEGRHEGLQAEVVPLRRGLGGGAVHGGYRNLRVERLTSRAKFVGSFLAISWRSSGSYPLSPDAT